MFDENAEVPRWLSSLLSEKFFENCMNHEEEKKRIFCLDCCEALCPYCSLHRSHRLLQIRRYVYYDVVKVTDANNLIDCAQIQSYTSNRAKVVFLNQRPQPMKPTRVTSCTLCVICDRTLHMPSIYCSISCKLQHILGTGCGLSEYLLKCEEVLGPSDSGLDDGEITPDSVLEPAGSVGTESGSSSNGPTGLMDRLNLTCTATTEVVRRKRSNLSTLSGIRSAQRPACRPVCEITGALMNRRKGNPHRSPLY